MLSEQLTSRRWLGRVTATVIMGIGLVAVASLPGEWGISHGQTIPVFIPTAIPVNPVTGVVETTAPVVPVVPAAPAVTNIGPPGSVPVPVPGTTLSGNPAPASVPAVPNPFNPNAFNPSPPFSPFAQGPQGPGFPLGPPGPQAPGFPPGPPGPQGPGFPLGPQGPAAIAPPFAQPPGSVAPPSPGELAPASAAPNVAPAAPPASSALSLREQFYGALDRGDVPAVMALFADDAVYQGTGSCRATPCVGSDAIRAEMQRLVADGAQVTAAQADGSVDRAAGTWAATGNQTQQAGVPRVVGSDVMQLRGDRIAALGVVYDGSDPATAAFLDWLNSQGSPAPASAAPLEGQPPSPPASPAVSGSPPGGDSAPTADSGSPPSGDSGPPADSVAPDVSQPSGGE